MFMTNNLGDFVLNVIFYSFLVVAVYQFVRARTLRRFIGLITLTGIVVLYTIGQIFFPHSPFTSTWLTIIPPIGLVGSVYYLTYPERRNRFVTGLSIFFIVAIVGTYLFSLINR